MNIFANSDSIISEVINRVLNCRQMTHVHAWGDVENELGYLYDAVKIEKWDELAENKVIYLRVETIGDAEKVEKWICDYRQTEDFIIYVPEQQKEIVDKLSKYGTAYPLREISVLDGYLFLIGLTFDRKDAWIPDENFKVLAILHFYNEADILERTIEYLIEQEVDIYLLDNWSDDGSYEIACRWKDKYPERIFTERFPIEGKTECYEWHRQLARTEEISKSTDYSWYIHYDTDEIRISPWKGVSLRQALYWIDCLGYNCLENTVIDFKLTDATQENIFMQDTYFDFRHKFLWYDQLKTWKKTEEIDIKTTGGHTARFKNPRVFPLKFLNKHYPLRGIEQAERKIFKERIPRFAKEKEQFGWHGHYDKYLQDVGILTNKKELLLWREETSKRLYLSLFMECGLRWDEEIIKENLPNLINKRIVIYGAGRIGQRLFMKLSAENEIIEWIDKSAGCIARMNAISINGLDVLKNISFDYIVILIKKESIRQQVINDLCEMNIELEKIVCLQ